MPYFNHLDGNHIARKNTVFDGNVCLSMAAYQALDTEQHHACHQHFQGQHSFDLMYFYYRGGLKFVNVHSSLQ